MTAPLLDALDATASVLPLAYEGHARVVLARMDRAAYERSAFLDQRAKPADPNLVRVGVGELEAAAAGVTTRATRLLLHSAFCGSTLLARLLDAEGRCLAYKEPLVVHQLSLRARTEPGTGVERGIDLMAALLSRGFDAEAALVKPTDTASNLGAPLLDRHPASRALVLADGLDGFVVSLLRTREHRAFLRTICGRAAFDLRGHAAARGKDANDLDDAPAAALLWLGLARVFCDLRDRHPARTAFVHADTLRDDPVEALRRALDGYGVDQDERAAVLDAADAKLARHSKLGTAVDPDALHRERAEAQAALGREIAAARSFVRARSAQALGERFEALLATGR